MSCVIVWKRSIHNQPSKGMDALIRSRQTLFKREESQAAEPQGSSSALAEAAHRLQLWESQTDLVEEHERVSLTSPTGSIIFVPQVKAHSAVSFMVSKDLLLIYDSDIIDVLSVETDVFNRCFLLDAANRGIR